MIATSERLERIEELLFKTNRPRSWSSTLSALSGPSDSGTGVRGAAYSPLATLLPDRQGHKNHVEKWKMFHSWLVFSCIFSEIIILPKVLLNNEEKLWKRTEHVTHPLGMLQVCHY